MTADLARWSLETQPIISMCGYQQNRRTPEDRVVPENLKSTGDKMADARIVVLGEKKVGKSGEFRKLFPNQRCYFCTSENLSQIDNFKDRGFLV